MMSLLLTVSETFSAFWDSASVFLQNCWGQLTAGVSITMVVGFITRYIMYKIKNNKTITNAISKATGAVQTSTDTLNKKIDSFEEKTTEMFSKFEEQFEKRFEDKFVDLKKKRVKAYHSIMKGTNDIQEELTAINEGAKKIDEELAKETVKPDINEITDALHIDEVKAEAKKLEDQAKDVVVEVVDETSKQITKKISTNQVLR